MAYADITSICISPAIAGKSDETVSSTRATPVHMEYNGIAPNTPGSIVISATDGTLTVLVISDPQVSFLIAIYSRNNWTILTNKSSNVI